MLSSGTVHLIIADLITAFRRLHRTGGSRHYRSPPCTADKEIGPFW